MKSSMWQLKDCLMGCGAVILSNSCLLAVSYLAKHQPVSPGEIMAMRSVLQVIVFGVWSMFQGIRVGQEPLKYKPVTWIVVALANIVLTSMQILCFLAVKMLPLSDFIVFCFTSPVFTLAASFIILRKKCSVVDVILCTAIVVGATLVSQPTFIFGNVPKGPQYVLGAGLSISVAAGAGIFAVLSSKCKEVPTGVFMMKGGLMSMAVGLTYCGIFPNNNFRADVEYIAILVLMGVLSMSGIVFMRIAALFISPVLVSMMRTFEIVMALVLEICIASHMFDFGHVSFWYKVIGCVVVTLSAVGMAVSDKIASCLPKLQSVKAKA